MTWQSLLLGICEKLSLRLVVQPLRVSGNRSPLFATLYGKMNGSEKILMTSLGINAVTPDTLFKGILVKLFALKRGRSDTVYSRWKVDTVRALPDMQEIKSVASVLLQFDINGFDVYGKEFA